MDRQPLDNLVRIGQLKKEPADRTELNGLIRAAQSVLDGVIALGT